MLAKAPEILSGAPSIVLVGNSDRDTCQGRNCNDRSADPGWVRMDCIKGTLLLQESTQVCKPAQPTSGVR
jgi:hypothetical protein